MRSIRFWSTLFSLAMVLSGFAGCGKPEPVVVVTVGGLGFSQMHDLRMALISQCPQAKVISAGAWDAYKQDIKGIATARPHEHIILIGHSFGCEAIDHAAAQLPHVDLAVFIDPAWDDFKLSKNISQCLWFKRSDFGIEREAHIVGASGPQTIKGDHNGIPHSPELITEVVNAINAIKVQPPAKADADNSQKPQRDNRALVAGGGDGANGF